MAFLLFYDWIILHLLFLFICWCIFRLPSCLGYCIQYCSEHGGCMYIFELCFSADDHLCRFLLIPFSPFLVLFFTSCLPHLVPWFAFSFPITRVFNFFLFCTLGMWLISGNEVSICLIFVKHVTCTEISEALETPSKALTKYFYELKQCEALAQEATMAQKPEKTG